MSIDRILQQKYDAMAVLATFGEQVRYLPKGGDPRTLTAVLERSDSLDAQGGMLADEEMCKAMVLRDDTDTTYGGIAFPQIGDGMQIIGDPEERLFSWDGQVIDKSTHVWSLSFKSKCTKRAGSNTR